VFAIVSGAPRQPEFVARGRILLCPAELPRQPFHAVAEQGAPREVIAQVKTRSAELAAEVFRGARQEHPSLAVAAVAMGRTQVPADLDRIFASHMLLHTAEGELYRDVLSAAAGDSGLRVVRFLNKEVQSEAAAALGWTIESLGSRLVEFGRQAGRPWTKDEKDATAAAMLALATIS